MNEWLLRFDLRPVKTALQELRMSVNLLVSTTFSYLLFTAFAWSSQALAEEKTDGHWFRNSDDAWCFIKREQSEFCLPTDFELQRFETGQAQFARDSLYEPITLINYESGPAQAEIDFLLGGDLWQLIGSQIAEDVVVTRIERQVSKRDDAHGIILSILEFDCCFFLIISSSDQATHKMLTESLTSQWNANKDG